MAATTEYFRSLATIFAVLAIVSSAAEDSSSYRNIWSRLESLHRDSSRRQPGAAQRAARLSTTPAEGGMFGQQLSSHRGAGGGVNTSLAMEIAREMLLPVRTASGAHGEEPPRAGNKSPIGQKSLGNGGVLTGKVAWRDGDFVLKDLASERWFAAPESSRGAGRLLLFRAAPVGVRVLDPPAPRRVSRSAVRFPELAVGESGDSSGQSGESSEQSGESSGQSGESSGESGESGNCESGTDCAVGGGDLPAAGQAEFLHDDPGSRGCTLRVAHVAHLLPAVLVLTRAL